MPKILCLIIEVFNYSVSDYGGSTVVISQVKIQNYDSTIAGTVDNIFTIRCYIL